MYNVPAAILLRVRALLESECVKAQLLVAFYLSFLVKSDILGEKFSMCTFQATIGPSVFVFLIVQETNEKVLQSTCSHLEAKANELLSVENNVSGEMEAHDAYLKVQLFVLFSDVAASSWLHHSMASDSVVLAGIANTPTCQSPP